MGLEEIGKTKDTGEERDLMGNLEERRESINDGWEGGEVGERVGETCGTGYAGKGRRDRQGRERN